MKVVKALST